MCIRDSYNPHDEPKLIEVKVEVPAEQVSLAVVWGEVEAEATLEEGVAVITGGLLKPRRTAVFLLTKPLQDQGTHHSVSSREPSIVPKYIIVIIVILALASVCTLLAYKKRKLRH